MNLSDRTGHIHENSFCNCEEYHHNNWIVRMKDLKESIRIIKKEIGRRLPIRKEEIDKLFEKEFGRRLTGDSGN